MSEQDHIYDVFISHAFEDKADVARPLAQLLERSGLRVWFDEAELTPGNSLSSAIDAGLATPDMGW
jgi:TIR domain